MSAAISPLRSKLSNATDLVMRPATWWMQRNDMRALGIARTRRIARAYNRMKFRPIHRLRQALYREHFDQLLAENNDGVAPANGIRMQDGLYLDESKSLPHLDRMLDDAEQIIRANGGKKFEDFGKPYFQSILPSGALSTYPSLLDFATSSALLKPVCDYMGCVPVLSTGEPRGVRFMESTTKFDPDADGPPRESQLWHIDYHDAPMVDVIVALRDISIECGPLHYLPASTSTDAARTLRYWSRGVPYRLTDEMFYNVVDRDLVRRFTVPRGMVLFLDSTACFHYGSRNAVQPRYHLQLAYVSACRTIFNQKHSMQRAYPSRDGESKLRKLVLDVNEPA